jgi:hypothetical protein
MAITYHAGRRIQGIAGVDVAGSFTSTTNPSGAALSLGGGSGSGNTKIGFEVQTGHFLVNKGLKTLTFALDRYNPVSGNGYVSVYDSTGTQKGDSSSTYDLSTLTQYPDPVDYTFTWTTPITIATGDRIVLEGGTFSTTAQVDLYSDNSSASEAYVNGVYFNSGWNSSSGTDVHFDVTTVTNNGDTKPTNVQLGSRFEETDTRKMYNYIGEQKIHTFTTTGNSTFQITAGSGNVEYLVVAGGAGGGSGGAGGAGGGGGGAGGARTGTLSLSTSTGSSGSHTVTVGALGAGATTTNTLYNALGANARGSNGVNSVFDSITSTGGGGGAAGGSGTYGIGVDGGSGGGDAYYQGAGSGISGQGHDGGDSPASGGSGGDWNGGGGGGAGAAGAGGTSGGGGAGGSGLQSSINGTATYYAGGGGGAVWQDSSITGGAGGSSLGGAGGNYNSGGSDATGYGSGGGGGGVTGSGSQPSYAGGDGSQGIVIIRYINDGSITATGGTITTAGEWQEIGA